MFHMRICGGPHIATMAAAMGFTPVQTDTMGCSHISGTGKALVCDADLYHSGTPAQYLSDKIEQFITRGLHPVRVIHQLHQTIQGGYACAWKHKTSTYLFRDLMGIKPLYYKKSAFASERKAFQTTPYMVLPGQVVKIPGGPLFRTVITPINKIPTVYDLLDALKKSVNYVGKNAGILFSGGIDSSILAALSDAVLITCGLENSKDVVFARKAAEMLDRDLIEVILTKEEIEKAVPHVLSIIDQKTLMHVELGLLLYFVCQQCDKEILVSGQGADELFGGYYKYKQAFQAGKDVRKQMKHDLTHIYTGLQRDNHIAEYFKKTVRYPYLNVPVVKIAQGVPTQQLFVPQRKEFLRTMARHIPLPEKLVSRPKKALQYGSGIHKIVQKMDISL